MKRLISGLFSSISDAELFMAAMGQENEDSQATAPKDQTEQAVITESYESAQEQDSK